MDEQSSKSKPEQLENALRETWNTAQSIIGELYSLELSLIHHIEEKERLAAVVEGQEETIAQLKAEIKALKKRLSPGLWTRLCGVVQTFNLGAIVQRNMHEVPSWKK